MGFEHGYALLVGVGGDLAVTANDVTDLADLLRDPVRAGYPEKQVHLRMEGIATRDHILAAFATLRGQIKQDAEATAIVYYSGHGLKFAGNGSTEYFLCPTGFDRARMKETGISDVELTNELLGLNAKRLIVLLDCCHAAGLPTAKDSEHVGKSALPPDVLAKLGAGEGQVVFTSCKDDQLSYALEGARNSVFTTCLLEALGGKAIRHDGFACILEVVAHVMRHVPKLVNNQNPVLNHALMLTENLPICVVPNVQDAPATAMAAAPSSPRRDADARRFTEDRIEALRPAFKKVLDICARLSIALAVESNPLEQEKLRYQLESAEQRAKEFEKKIAALREKLDGFG